MDEEFGRKSGIFLWFESVNKTLFFKVLTFFFLFDLCSSSESDCLSFGLNPAELLCSTCDDLVQFQLKHLTSKCKECCKDDGSGIKEVGVKYPKAVLEVCG